MKHEYIYQEERHITAERLKLYVSFMLNCDFMPEDIEDDHQFEVTQAFLMELIQQEADFLPAYETLLRMLWCYEPNLEIQAQTVAVENRWYAACMRIAEKNRIFTKEVPWGWQENRPLIRGLYNQAEAHWKSGNLQAANELFRKIYQTNQNDNIGARYAIKATAEGMSYKDYEKRFINPDGATYNTEALWSWYEKK